MGMYGVGPGHLESGAEPQGLGLPPLTTDLPVDINQQANCISSLLTAGPCYSSRTCKWAHGLAQPAE